ncbi:MAG: protein kinase [Myxococcota bacterium]
MRWLPLEANGEAAVKACAKLPEHPMLPRIRQTGHVGGSAFVAMDFPEGALLSTFAGERLEVDRVIRLGAQLSDALATVHAQGVVHGEMSTDSVLLVEPDCAYLWDMPLVIANRLTDRRGENRLMQNLVKTAPFLAPERARGEGASQASDVYALGAVLCIAAGAPMPQASTTLAVVHQVAQGEWSPRVPMVLPDPWRSTIARMVSRDPAQRPTAAEVAEVFAELPTPAALPTVPEFPVVKLPPELLAAADALLRRPSLETPAVPAGPGRSRENDVPADADVGVADTVKRAAVAKAEASRTSTSGPKLDPVKTETSGPTAKAAVDAAVKASPSGPTAKAAEDAAVKASPSGPTAKAAVDAAVKASPSGPPVKAAVDAAEKASPSGPTAKAAVDAAVKASPSGPTAKAAVDAATATSAPVAEAVAVSPPAVQMTDTISVSHELAQAGAVTLSADEVEALQRSRRQVILVAGGLGGAILALLLVAFTLATAHAEPTVVPAPRPATVEPATRAVDAEEELAPLPNLSRPLRPDAAPAAKAEPAKAAAPAKAEPVTKTEAPAKAAAPESDSVAEPAPESTAAPDFGFLDTTAEAPTNELKRPNW